jgi:hypothetical protein
MAVNGTRRGRVELEIPYARFPLNARISDNFLRDNLLKPFHVHQGTANPQPAGCT